MGSDEVNSIADTPEAGQVAECIRTSYFNMTGRYDLPEHNQLFQLTPSNDPTKPVLMFRPDGVNRIEMLKYYDSNILDGTNFQQDQFGAFSHDLNVDIVSSQSWTTSSTTSNTISQGTKTFTVSANLPTFTGQSVTVFNQGINQMFGTVVSYTGTTMVLDITTAIGSGTYTQWTITPSTGMSPPGYKEVKLLPLEHFIHMMSTFDPASPDVGSFDLTLSENDTGSPASFLFYYKRDKQPQYWTIISDYYIIFDSYDITQDSTLQASKTMAHGWVIPSFLMEDNFTPNLDDQQFPLLLNEAKSLAFLELKQMPHPKAEKEVMRQLSSLQKFKFTAHRPSPIEDLPSFGRSHTRIW